MFSSPPLNGQSSLYTGLRHYWDLNGNSRDVFTTRQASTDTDVTYVTGKLGQAASFNGTTSKIITTAATPTGNSPWTMSCWVNSKQLSGYETQWSFYDQIYVGKWSNTSRYYVFDGAEIIWISDNLPLNTWNHLVVTYDGTTLKTYSNGSYFSQRIVAYAFTARTVWFGLYRGSSYH